MPKSRKQFVQVQRATVRFAGDSGDGMQLVGSEFGDIASMSGNALRTLPDFPAEIRAPAGTLAGVSGYQLHFGDNEVVTPGDAPFVLVAMNPAALKVHLPELEPGGVIVANEDEFTAGNLEKAGYVANPLEDGSLDSYRLVPVRMTTLNEEAVAHTGLARAERSRCKNFFALGLMLWLYDRPLQPVLEWTIKKFGRKRDAVMANGASLRAGYNYAETAELFPIYYRVAAAELPPGTYRRVTGNEAMALGCLAAAQRSGRPLVYASYPITPASEILQELSKHPEFDVRAIQAEDEIAACCMAIGASFSGAIGATGTSGPGLALKTEAIGLAVMVELPLIVIDVQRAGPSTGMPTKTEQGDLMMSLFGRHGESPAVVLAAATPADCFDTAVEAVRLAIKYMTPVLVLSDGFLATSAEPWRIPDPDDLPDLSTQAEPIPESYEPYRRDPATLARAWVRPGTPGLEHRVGGLEKEDITGLVSFSGPNHRQMMQLRAEKIARIADDIPLAAVTGPRSGDVLVVGWGSTQGAITAAVGELQAAGHAVAHLHLRHLNPLPRDVGAVLGAFRHVVVAENNLGQLATVLRAQFPVPIEQLNRTEGRPFLIREIRDSIKEALRRE
jgi:2-oxoglutarate ferredoxin oxidoreductase subunit alpha